MFAIWISLKTTSKVGNYVRIKMEMFLHYVILLPLKKEDRESDLWTSPWNEKDFI